MAYYATVKERLRYIYTYISIYYIKGKGSIHGNILEEALLNKSLKNAHSVNVIVRSFSIYLYLSEDQADLWARDKRNCSKDISCEVKTATNTNKYEEITCFQKVLKRGMSQYMFFSACFSGCGTLGAGSNNQNGNLRWFLPSGVGPPPLNGTNFQTFFYPTFFLLQLIPTYMKQILHFKNITFKSS